jgi:hypothetical protein
LLQGWWLEWWCFGGCLGAKLLYLSSVHIKDLSPYKLNLTLNPIQLVLFRYYEIKYIVHIV